MKCRTSLLLVCVLFGTISPLYSQSIFSSRSSDAQPDRTHIIRGIRSISDTSGFVFTSESILRTNDNGRNWANIGPQLFLGDAIASVDLSSDSTINALIIHSQDQKIQIASSNNNGSSWSRQELDFSDLDRMLI